MQKSLLLFTLFLSLLAGCDGAVQTPSPPATNGVDVSYPSSSLKGSEDGLDLVFQGGGAKGLAHIGAVRELERQGLTYRRLVGTSAGSIIVVLLASGYNADEMEAVITERTADGNIIMGSFLAVPEKDAFDEAQLRSSIAYLSLQDVLPEFIPNSTAEELDLKAVQKLLDDPNYRGMFSLVETGGLYSGALFISWLGEQLDRDGRGLGNATLAEFHQETGADTTIVATDADDESMLMLNHRTAPDLPVVWAVRMSSSMPFVFQEVMWQSEWGTYQGHDLSGHFIVDGGATANLPLELVLSQDLEVMAAMVLEPDPARVIGLALDHEEPVPGLALTPTPAVVADIEALENKRIEARWQEIETRTLNLVDTVLNAHDRLLAATYPEHVCELPVGGVGTLEYDMSDDKIEHLLTAAAEEMKSCLANLGK